MLGAGGIVTLSCPSTACTPARPHACKPLLEEAVQAASDDSVSGSQPACNSSPAPHRARLSAVAVAVVHAARLKLKRAEAQTAQRRPVQVHAHARLLKSNVPTPRPFLYYIPGPVVPFLLIPVARNTRLSILVR